MADGGTPSFEQTPKLPGRALESPETSASFEVPAGGSERALDPVPAAPIPVPAPASSAARKDPTTRGVESILEEDLADVYSRMNPALQAKFRKEGERVTGKIVAMVSGAKVKAREALGLILGWLKMIPGVNRFFLIQEAKIKTDKIMALAEEEKRKRGPL
ncbi:MAG: hypothetical protein AAB554_02215 [Patescibacteria group bacterium]